MVQIHLNRPIPLHTYTRERNDERNNAVQFEDVVLTMVAPTMVNVRSRDGTRTLFVLPSGRCSFDDERAEIFEVVEHADIKYLRSISRNHLLQYHSEYGGCFYCLNLDHEDARTIVFRSDQHGKHIHPLVWCISAGVAGAALVPAMGLGAAALVPTAMSTFGTVVSGVGTMHASLAAGGVAATLQASSAALLTTEAAAYGAAIGAALGLFKAKRDGNGGSERHHNDSDGLNSSEVNGDQQTDNPRDEQEPDDHEEGEDQSNEPKNSDSQTPGEFS